MVPVHLVKIGALALVLGGAASASALVPVRPSADVVGTAGSEVALRRAPRRIALFIGISDYKNFALDGPAGQTDLEGPANDVERMQKSLRRWGFGAAGDTRVLLDRAASKQGITDAFRWVSEQATDPSDVVVIYYSGHGSYADDRDGDEAAGLPGDTKDEGLVPWDAADIHDPDQLVLDDQIRIGLKSIRTPNVTLVVDACYSGTLTRGAGDAKLARPRGPKPSESGAAGAGLDLLTTPGHTLLTAASAREVAEELPFRAEDRVFGVFTYHLSRALDGAGPNARYDELMQQVRAQVSGSMVPQTPQLEGQSGARLFHVQGDVARRPFAVVTSRPGQQHVQLDIGAVHGVRRTALYDVHGPGEMTFRGKPIAQLQVDSVADRVSYARTIDPVALPNGARAVLARVPRGAKALEKLPIYVHPGAAAALPAVRALDFVQVVRDSSAADTHVRAAAPGVQVAVRGIPIPTTDGATGATEICGSLTRAYSIASMDLLRNDQPQLDFDVQVRVVESGRAPSDARTTVDTAYVGKHYDIYARVEAPDNSTFYLSAAAEGYTSSPMVLYPRREVMNQPFPLNQWVRILPRVPMEDPAGVEVIKVVIDSNQFDLHGLVDALPGCDRSRDGSGQKKGDRWRTDPSPVTGWKAVDHRVIILKSPTAAK
jgi:hypothetical protein